MARESGNSFERKFMSSLIQKLQQSGRVVTSLSLAALLASALPIGVFAQNGVVARQQQPTQQQPQQPKPRPTLPICGNSLSQNRSAARPAVWSSAVVASILMATRRRPASIPAPSRTIII